MRLFDLKCEFDLVKADCSMLLCVLLSSKYVTLCFAFSPAVCSFPWREPRGPDSLPGHPEEGDPLHQRGTGWRHRGLFASVIIMIIITGSYTGWPIKNRMAYFPQYVDAITGISVWGNFSWEKWYQDHKFWFSSLFSRAHFVRQCRGPKISLLSCF